MHPIWHFFDTMPTWAQGIVLSTILGCVVYAAKGIASKSSGLIHGWLERRLQKAIVRALATGDENTVLYLTTLEIADAVKRKAIRVLRSLERLESEKRVVQKRMHNQTKWCLTLYEWHDRDR